MVVDYPVVVELSRDVVDDERHHELQDYLLAIHMYPIVVRAYLNDDTDQNESLIFALFADILPPNFEAKSPVLGTPEPLPFWEYWLEELFLCDQGSLPLANDEQLLVVSLVQADSDGQVQAHAPILHLAWESTVHRIDDEDDEGEDMHCEQGQEHKWDIPHSKDGMVPVKPGKDAC